MSWSGICVCRCLQQCLASARCAFGSKPARRAPAQPSTTHACPCHPVPRLRQVIATSAVPKIKPLSLIPVLLAKVTGKQGVRPQFSFKEDQMPEQVRGGAPCGCCRPPPLLLGLVAAGLSAMLGTWRLALASLPARSWCAPASSGASPGG